MNTLQLIQMIRGGVNPHAIANMLRQKAGNNIIMNNALNMAENGDAKGVEELARNLYKENNIDINGPLEQVKNFMGM